MNRTTMDRVAEVVGWEGTLRISAAFGGLTLYVPTSLGADHPLITDLGEDVASALVGEFAGEYLSVPRKDYSSLRRARFARLLAQRGVSPALYAALTDCSKTTARREMGLPA